MCAINVALLLSLAVHTALAAEARAPAEDQFVIVPLRVHILSSSVVDLANCRLTDADALRVIAGVNAIWHPAGIHFGLEKLVREPAAQQERFRPVTEKRGGEFGPTEVAMLLPSGSRDLDGLHAYLFHELPYNSNFLGDDAVVVQEGAQVRQVPRGGDDTVARVMAHALGRALALANFDDPRNVMANGTSGVALDGRQAERARKVARTIRGAATAGEVRKVAEAAEAAEAKGETAEARRLRSWLAEVSSAVAAEARKPAAQPSEEPIAYEKYLVVPLRVHVLTAPDLELANTRLSDAEVERVLGHVDAIWHRAGIHFGRETLCRELPDQRERYRLTTDGVGGQFDLPERMLLPRSSRSFDGLHAYVFHELPFNSTYLGDDAVLVQEGAQLNPVEGGTDDPVARVTAHALGYALGLPNHPDPANLMANGTSGATLDDDQVNLARSVAPTLRGVATTAEVRKAALAAQASGERAQTRRLWSWLAEIPGAGAAEATRRRDKLDQLSLP